MQPGDLEQVLEWRNHPDVRRHMFSANPISAQEHLAWFDRTNRDPQRRLLIFERGGVPSGFVQFGPFDPAGAAPWGFYVAPGAAAGTGTALGAAALDFAFGELGLHKVSGEALAHNERSIRFHLRLGFNQEGRLIARHFDGRDHHDVLRFGLLAVDWRNRTRPHE
jgi:UDP-4-amino-4,6-dideoxy-N-acetyl-beta-L-altrosamine N-acetyltransferase